MLYSLSQQENSCLLTHGESWGQSPFLAVWGQSGVWGLPSEPGPENLKTSLGYSSEPPKPWGEFVSIRLTSEEENAVSLKAVLKCSTWYTSWGDLLGWNPVHFLFNIHHSFRGRGCVYSSLCLEVITISLPVKCLLISWPAWHCQPHESCTSVKYSGETLCGGENREPGVYNGFVGDKNETLKQTSTWYSSFWQFFAFLRALDLYGLIQTFLKVGLAKLGTVVTWFA